MANRYRPRKLRELILYIAGKSESDPAFGQTKLNKLLYYCDFSAYVELGESITGARYQRLPHGPAPKAMMPIQASMKKDKDLLLRRGMRYGYPHVKPIALRDAHVHVFTGPQVALIDKIVERLWALDATQISELSHQEVGWEVATDREDIPYETAFIESLEPA